MPWTLIQFCTVYLGNQNHAITLYLPWFTQGTVFPSLNSRLLPSSTNYIYVCSRRSEDNCRHAQLGVRVSSEEGAWHSEDQHPAVLFHLPSAPRQRGASGTRASRLRYVPHLCWYTFIRYVCVLSVSVCLSVCLSICLSVCLSEEGVYF